MSKLRELVLQTFRYRYVVVNYVATTLGNRYKGSLLGYLWSLVFPLLRYGLMAFVFSFVLKNTSTANLARLVTGLLVFGFMGAVISTGMNAFVGNAHFIKKLYVPKPIFLLNPLLYELTNFLLVLAAVIPLGWLIGVFPLSPAAAFLPVSLALTCVFLFGFTACLAVMYVFFKDTQYFVELLLQTLVFITPIFFSEEMLPRELYAFNPFYYFLKLLVDPILRGVVPGAEILGPAFLWALALGGVGVAVILKNEAKLVFRL